MSTRRYYKSKGKKTRSKRKYGGKIYGGKKSSSSADKKTLRKQALSNARKLFGSI